MTPAGSSTNAAAQPALSWAMPPQRVRVGERALELRVDDRVGVTGLVAPGVAHGALALVVGPAGAVGDDLPVVADEQPAEDLSERVQLGFGGLDQAGADTVLEPEVTSARLGVAGASLGVAGASLGAAVLVFDGSRSSSSLISAPAK